MSEDSGCSRGCSTRQTSRTPTGRNPSGHWAVLLRSLQEMGQRLAGSPASPGGAPALRQGPLSLTSPPGKTSCQSQVPSQISTSWVHLIESSLLKGIISLLSPSLRRREAGSQSREAGRLGLGDWTERGTKKRGDRRQRAHWALRGPRGQGLLGLRSTLQPTSQLRPASPAGLLTPQENPAQHLGAGAPGSGA